MIQRQARKFELWEVSGDAYDRGFAYGSRYKRLISTLLQSHYVFYDRYFKISPAQMRKRASKCCSNIESYSPEIYEEVRGTAAGAALAEDDLAVLVAFCEVYYSTISGGCTAFAVSPPATAPGEACSGMNNDEALDPWVNGDCAVVVRFRRKSGPDVMSYLWAGVLGMIGLNTSGISVCTTLIQTEQVLEAGVPHSVIMREVLQQSNLENAVEAIERASRAVSLNYLIADETGRACNVEATPSGCDKWFAKNGVLVHTNHILSRNLAFRKDMVLASGISFGLDTEFRYGRMSDLVESNAGNVTLTRMFDFLRDHSNHPSSICRHPNPAEPLATRSRTMDSLVMVPAKREMWIAHGNPCENEFLKYA